LFRKCHGNPVCTPVLFFFAYLLPPCSCIVKRADGQHVFPHGPCPSANTRDEDEYPGLGLSEQAASHGRRMARAHATKLQAPSCSSTLTSTRPPPPQSLRNALAFALPLALSLRVPLPLSLGSPLHSRPLAVPPLLQIPALQLAIALAITHPLSFAPLPLSLAPPQWPPQLHPAQQIAFALACPSWPELHAQSIAQRRLARSTERKGAFQLLLAQFPADSS
jgi:hypothetical protein